MTSARQMGYHLPPAMRLCEGNAYAMFWLRMQTSVESRGNVTYARGGAFSYNQEQVCMGGAVVFKNDIVLKDMQRLLEMFQIQEV